MSTNIVYVVTYGYGPVNAGAGWPNMSFGPVEFTWNGEGTVKLCGDNGGSFGVDDAFSIDTALGHYEVDMAGSRVGLQWAPKDFTYLFQKGVNSVTIHLWSTRPSLFSFTKFGFITTGLFNYEDDIPPCKLDIDIL